MRDAAPAVPAIEKALLELADALTPAKVRNRGRIASACHRVARWAAENGRGELAVQMSEAAMALVPTNPRALFESARMNRAFGNFMAAEILYGRAIPYARKRNRWRIFVRAHLGMGQLCISFGRRDKAAAHFSAAAKAATKRSGEKWLAGMTHHDLLVFHSHDERFEAAFNHAQLAAEVMPVHNKRLPIFVHDYCVLLVRMHAYRFALPLLEAVVQKPIAPPDQLIVWSTLGRAAAGAQRVDRYLAAARCVEDIHGRYGLRASPAHANLAFGAYALGLMDECRRQAEAGIELATARRENGIRNDIQALLRAVEAGEPGPVQSACDRLPPAMEAFTEDLAARLTAWRGPTWKRKRQAGPEKLGSV